MVATLLNLDSVLIALDKHHILDKTGHFLGFMLLNWVVHYVIKVDIVISTSTLILYAGFTEIGQSYLSFRSGQFSDFVADALGCLMYALLVVLHKRLVR